MLRVHIRLTICEYIVCAIFILKKTMIIYLLNINLLSKLYNNLLSKY